MLVKLTKEFPTVDSILSNLHMDVEWATSSQLTEMLGIGPEFSSRVGTVLGYAGRKCVELKYKNKKVRAWYFGSSPIENWNLPAVRHRLVGNDIRLEHPAGTRSSFKPQPL